MLFEIVVVIIIVVIIFLFIYILFKKVSKDKQEHNDVQTCWSVLDALDRIFVSSDNRQKLPPGYSAPSWVRRDKYR